MADPTFVPCPRCHTLNRVMPGRAGAVCGRCQAPLGGGGGGATAAQASAAGSAGTTGATGAIALTDRTFQQEVLEAPGFVLVDFWAAWCGPCRMLAPTIEAIAAEYAGRLKVGKLNVEQERGVSGQLRIMSLPTLMLFKDGRIVDQLAGALPADQLRAWLAQRGVR